MISDEIKHLYFFSLNCQDGYFSNYRYTLYRFNTCNEPTACRPSPITLNSIHPLTETEIFDEVNAGGIAPKERRQLNSVFYDWKIFVFGSPEASREDDDRLDEDGNNNSNNWMNFLYVFDLH